MVAQSTSNAAAAYEEALEIKSRMLADTERRVMSGTEWLASTDLYSELQTNPLDGDAMLARWLAHGQLFALERDGLQIAPRYAFNSALEPVPSLREVLKMMQGRSPFQIAAWFESTSSFLAGKRPREVLLQDGAAVVMAAQHWAEGPIHG